MVYVIIHYKTPPLLFLNRQINYNFVSAAIRHSHKPLAITGFLFADDYYGK